MKLSFNDKHPFWHMRLRGIHSSSNEIINLTLVGSQVVLFTQHSKHHNNLWRSLLSYLFLRSNSRSFKLFLVTQFFRDWFSQPWFCFWSLISVLELSLAHPYSLFWYPWKEGDSFTLIWATGMQAWQCLKRSKVVI